MGYYWISFDQEIVRENLFLPQSDDGSRFSAPVIFDGCIVFFGGIHIFMPKGICNQINIAGFLIKCGTKSRAKLMTGDLLLGHDGLCIFSDKIFNSVHRNAPFLNGVEQGVFVTALR